MAGKKIYDEDGNFLGEWIENVKDTVEMTFGESVFVGLIFLLFIAPGWAAFGLFLFLLWKLIKSLFKLALFILKTALKILWWILRLPFCLIFQHEFPEF